MLVINKLTKRYGAAGISEVSFCAEEGTVTGIVGPNGVGKTTLLQCIAGILVPDSGRIMWQGSPVRYPAGDVFGYLPEFPSLPRFLTPRQTVLYMLQMKRMSVKQDEVDKILGTYQLSNYSEKKNQTLSQGMIKRVAMCIAFLGDPPVLLLDEPTNGLDTSGLLLLKDLIHKAQSLGTTVLISSHVLDFLSNINTQTLFLKGSESQLVECKTGLVLEETYKSLFGLR